MAGIQYFRGKAVEKANALVGLAYLSPHAALISGGHR
jgi:hypothetical protein